MVFAPSRAWPAMRNAINGLPGGLHTCCSFLPRAAGADHCLDKHTCNQGSYSSENGVRVVMWWPLENTCTILSETLEVNVFTRADISLHSFRLRLELMRQETTNVGISAIAIANTACLSCTAYAAINVLSSTCRRLAFIAGSACGCRLPGGLDALYLLV